MDNIKKNLKFYPTSFDVSDSIRDLTNEQKETIKNKLLHELDSSVDEFSTTMEKVRVLNLLSYLCFILGDKENAIDYNRKALETNQCSIIALSNKAWLSLELTRNYSDCLKVCEQLKKFQKDEMANLIAKAEIAFTYARLGLKHYKKAVQEFKEVIEEIEKEHSKEKVVLSPSVGGNSDSEIMAEYYCVWMYGCALSIQRLFNLNNMRDIYKMEQVKVNYKYVVELYSRILDLCADQSKCIQRYQARSYIELGVMAYDVTRKKLTFPHGMASLFPESSSHMLQTREYFSKALEIFPNDVFVLERSGRYFRYIKEMQLSIDLLEKAISIKETSFGHHHLALSYKRLLEINSQEDLVRNLNSMTIDGESTMWSCTGQNAEENVGSVASCNQESTIYRRSKTNDVLQRYAGKLSNRSSPADRQGYLEGKSSKTNHSKLQSNQKLAEFQYDKTCHFPSPKKNDTRSNTLYNCSGQGYCNRYQESRHAELKKGLQTRVKSESSADDRSNYCEKSKPHFNEQKDMPSIKCPRDPVLINYEENKAVVAKIFSHLDRARELSTNTTASYDKAILYRQMKQPAKALEILEQLMHQHLRDVNSPVMLANIYEQAAFCISAMLVETNSKDAVTVEQLVCNRDIYLKSCLEISCDVIANIPHLHKCWESASTLKEILLDRSNNNRNKETLRDLLFLHDKLDSHFEAIGVLKELKDLVEDDEQPEIIEDLVRRHMHLGNYEEAVLALRMTKKLQHSFLTINEELYLQVHIEAGLDAFKQKHFEKARSRIRQALDFQCGHDARLEEMTSDETCFELFVLSNLDCDDAGRRLTTLLAELGVKTTFNIDSHSVLPGTPELQGITEMMMKSEAFAILIDFDTEDKKMQHVTARMQIIKQNRKDDPLTVVLTSPGTELSPDSIYSVYDAIHMNIALLSDTESMLRDERMCKSIKELLLYIAKRHCASNGRHA